MLELPLVFVSSSRSFFFFVPPRRWCIRSTQASKQALTAVVCVQERRQKQTKPTSSLHNEREDKMVWVHNLDYQVLLIK